MGRGLTGARRLRDVERVTPGVEPEALERFDGALNGRDLDQRGRLRLFRWRPCAAISGFPLVASKRRSPRRGDEEQQHRHAKRSHARPKEQDTSHADAPAPRALPGACVPPTVPLVMALRSKDRRIDRLLVAVGIGFAVRLLCLVRDPLLHPDGPAYLRLAANLLHGDVVRVLTGYYSPLYPALVAGLGALGLPLPLAGRVAAGIAGLAMLPFLHGVVRSLLGERAAGAAVLVAALHPALVKASAQILPESLAATLLLAWMAALLAARGARGLAAAGALAGVAYLARPEGALLLPLGVAAAAGRRHRAGGLVVYLGAGLLVMAPVVVALHARSGRWELSPREARIMRSTGLSGEKTLLGAVRQEPVAVLRRIVAGAGRQLADDAKALGPLLWLPFAFGLFGGPPRGEQAWPLLVAGAFTALPLAINPSPRYAVPLVPLLLPTTAAGLLALGARLGRGAPLAAAALGVGLTAQALWLSHPFDRACWEEVRSLLRTRYGADHALVAVDGRFAYGAGWEAVVPDTTDPDDALALARRTGTRLWMTRPSWIRGWHVPTQAKPAARPCGGTFVLFELEDQ